MMKSSMTEDYGFIKSEVEKLSFERNDDTETTNSYKDDAQGLNNTDDSFIDENQLIPIFNGYTIFNGEKYFVSVDNKFQSVLRAIKIKPVSKEEMKDESLIDFPVCVSWFSPYR
jgi:hypothetical protein